MTMPTPRFILHLLSVVTLALTYPALAQQPTDAPVAAQPAPATAPESRFVRVHDSDDRKVISMQLAAREYTRVGTPGPRVTLVSAVHIGDQSFYAALQNVLDPMDAVLYEGVRPAGAGRTEFDTEADSDARKAKRTERRIRLLAIAANMQKADGHYPPAISALVESADPRLKTALAGADVDAWGRPFEYSVAVAPTSAPANDASTPDGATNKDTAPTPTSVETLQITSLGADGQPGGEGPNADLRLSDQPALKPSEIPRSAGGSAKGKGLQQELAGSLGLEFQLDAMTHERTNWRSSDLAVDQVQERIAAAGGDAQTLFKTLDGSSFQAGLLRVVLALMKLIPGGPAMGKLIMIEALARADDLMRNGGAPGLDARTMNVIVHDRNAVVIADLKKIIDTEPDIKTVGIIYGAAHMPDLESQLKSLGYTESKVTWHDSMTVDLDQAGIPKQQAQSLRKQIRTTLDRQIKTLQKAAARKQAKAAEDEVPTEDSAKDPTP
jgi:hypothetical protein